MDAPPAIKRKALRKAQWEQRQNVKWCLEHILEAISHKMIAVWPRTSYLTNHLSKISKGETGYNVFYELLYVDAPELSVQQVIIYISFILTLDAGAGVSSGCNG